MESIGLHVVNGLMISCEDALRSFEDMLEEESVVSFFGELYASHEITRSPETRKE